MRIKIFSIPIIGGEALEEGMNKFLQSHKIIDIESELSSSNRGTYWTFCVRYAAHSASSGKFFKKYEKQKIDYQKKLGKVVFERFMRFKKIRKKLAEDDAVPAFAVFTDAELSELAKLDKLTESNMRSIEGIGKKKVEKYAQKFMLAVQQAQKEGNETNRTADT